MSNDNVFKLIQPGAFDKVKGVEDRLTRSVPSAQILEPRQAIWPQHHRLASMVKLLALICSATAAIRRQSHGPVVCVAAVDSHCGAVPADHHPVPVVLDFVNPIGTGRRL